MEKSTKKFLSILLCIAMLMSFPIVANANQAYDETFKGSYTAPSQATNTLISGDDARLTEWYGDRVNAGSKTYSVCQNQYGLNEDGNIIEAKQQTKYTLWLAQYGVATLKFVVPEDGQYVITTSRNKQYSNDKKPSVSHNDIRVYEDIKGNKDAALDIASAKDKTDNVRYASALTHKYLKGDVIYVAASAAFGGYETQSLLENDNYFLNLRPNDMVYDIEIRNVDDIDPDTCTHAFSYRVSREQPDDSCIETETRECKLCGKSFILEYENHDYVSFETKEPEDAKCGEKQKVTFGDKCSRCKKEEYVHTYTTYTDHKLGDDKKLVDPNDEIVKDFWRHYSYNGGVNQGWEAFYEGTCVDCGRYIRYQLEESPCRDEKDKNHVKHDFDVDESSIDCQHPATCKTCGYTAAPHKYPKKYNEYTNYYDIDYSKDSYKGSKCEKTYVQCTVCGEYKYNVINHKKVRYIQVTPQYGKVCGTYKIHCDECNEDITPVLTCHSYYTVENEDGTYTKKCSRCEQPYRDDNNGGNPGGGSTGGTTGGSTGGNQGGSSDGSDTSAPAPGTSDNNVNNNTTNLNNNSSTQNQPKFKRIVLNNIKAQKKGVVVAWDAAKNVTGYQLQLATDKKFKQNKKTITVTNKKVTKKTVKKLKSKKKYYVRVRAYKKQNGKRTYSSWSKTKSFKTK